MAIISNLIARLTLDSKAFDRNSRRASQTTKSLTRNMLSLQRTVIGLAGTYLGARGLYRGFQSVTRAAMVQERAEKTLAASLRLTGDATASNVAQLKSYASALQKVTTYGDEQILQAMAYGKAVGLNTAEMGKAAQAAIGLAAAYNTDLQSAIRLVALAYKGETGQLKERGIIIDASLPAIEKYNKLVAIGAERFTLAAEKTRDAMGAAEQLKNSWGDAKEALGSAFLPAMSMGFSAFDEWLQENRNAIKRWADDFVEGLGVVADGMKLLRDNAKQSAEAVNRLFGFAGQPPLDTMGTGTLGVGELSWLSVPWGNAEAAPNAVDVMGPNMKSLRQRLNKVGAAGPGNAYGLPNLNLTATPGQGPGGPGGAATKTTIDIASAYRRMYNDMDRRSEESWRVRSELLAQEYREYIALAQNKMEAERVLAWFREQQAKLDIERAKATGGFFGGMRAGIEEMKRELPTIGELGTDVARSLRDGVVNSLSDAVFEARNLGDALKSVARDAARITFEWALTRGLTSILPSVQGHTFGPGGVMPFAHGGIVTRPTLFPFAGGAGLMGEKGPEAILPLKRGSGGRLGVESSGGGRTESLLRDIVSLLRQQVQQGATPVVVTQSREEVYDALRHREGQRILMETIGRNI